MMRNSTDNPTGYAERGTNASLLGDSASRAPQAGTTPKAPATRPGGLGGGRQITRNRASYSCHTCRRRKVHPVCGNCLKNGTECVYDTTVPKKGTGADNRGEDYHGVKRRREMSRPLDGDTDESQSFLGGWRDARGNLPEPRGSSQAIEARLDKLTSLLEQLSKADRSLSVEEMSRQLLMMNQNGDWRSVPKSAGNGDTAKPASGSRPASPRRNADSSGDEFPIPSGKATDPVDPVGSLNLGHLSLEDGGKSRYVGTTYWAYISHEDAINELNQLLRDQNRSHDPSPPDESSTEEAMADQGVKSPARTSSYSTGGGSQRHRMSSQGDHFHKAILFPTGDSPSTHDRAVEPEMLENVPTKRQSDILYKGFMSGVHAISPVLHPPTVLKMYNAFWDWYDHSSYSGEQCPDPSFIPLLYAIWYGGSVTISIRTIKAEFNVSSRSVLSDMFNDQVTRWLTKISFPRSPTLHGLAAFLIVQTILSKEEEPLTSSLFISLALRVAQTMGLHRDPAQFGIQPCEAESRRRVWWHIVHMDGVVAMSSGLPPLVSDENYWDVRETSEVKDTLLGTPQAEHYTRLVAANLRPPDNPDDPTICGGPSMVNVFYLCARGKYIMARAIRRILKIQLGTRPITGRDMEELRSILVDLQYKLNSIVNRIPLAQHPGTPGRDGSSASDRSQSFSHSPANSRSNEGLLPGDGPSGCAEQYHTPVLVAFHKWARILLSLFIDKAFCVAYQPFLKNAKSRIWPAARQGALRHCHGFMEKFIALATDPDFQPFQWSWPGNHQPMHATMIMLIDLYERPNSPQASRSRAFIDKIFSLSGPDGGVVGGEDGITTARPLKDGGREAWDLMRRLREKAWRKAGLDPSQFWTEQAQIQAGVVPTPEKHSGPNSPTSFGNRSYSTSTHRPGKPDPQLVEFSSRFFDMTRAQTLPNPVVSALRQESPRYSVSLPPPMPASTASSSQPAAAAQTTSSSPQLPPMTHPMLNQGLDATLASLASSESFSAPNSQPAPLMSMSPSTSTFAFSNTTTNTNNNPNNNSSTTAPPDTDPTTTTTTTTTSMTSAAPTPPSMMDPNLTFDWDQWDAVFGQQLPVADELMELDPVAGLGLPDLGMGLGLG
ncbi:C6 transcription factor [Rasamsonia emersonii CBS 393.64]|uniref:C6 transcription factor n=1 Tax=Rasamsonia emersonii (strain ATCC 16479 / CBS 393.64 / IMI 116815) TaxID=1408163 RepID=A0A0F4YND9_RASE3|nr:C6 transcription factor [Rasamsonia emersonii CBS 393.64]KKA19782.1 C6 transcription factor [Rasamsonia emersonii CBS 393.64]